MERSSNGVKNNMVVTYPEAKEHEWLLREASEREALRTKAQEMILLALKALSVEGQSVPAPSVIERAREMSSDLAPGQLFGALVHLADVGRLAMSYRDGSVAPVEE